MVRGRCDSLTRNSSDGFFFWRSFALSSATYPFTAPDELARHPGLVQEASLLQRRYLVMLVLHDIGYRGHVVDPADRTAWDGDARPVPWLAGTAQPSMPPDRREIQAARRRERAGGSQRQRP